MRSDWFSIFARYQGQWHKVAEVRSEGLAYTASEAFAKIYGKHNVKSINGRKATTPTEGTPCQL